MGAGNALMFQRRERLGGAGAQAPHPAVHDVKRVVGAGLAGPDIWRERAAAREVVDEGVRRRPTSRSGTSSSPAADKH